VSLPPEFVGPIPPIPAAPTPEEAARELGPGPHPPDIRRLNILTEGLQPPTALWVTPDDLLIAGIRNSIAGVKVAVNGRLWLAGGEFANVGFTATPDTARALQFFQTPLQYGYLVSAAAYATGTLPSRGQTLVNLQVARPPFSAFLIYWYLAQDYLTSGNAVYWPGGRTIAGIEGPGVLYGVAVTTPAAGADWSQTVPTAARWRIRGVRATFATSAAVGGRYPRLQVDGGGATLYRVTTNISFGASATTSMNWGVPGATAEFTSPFDEWRALPLDLTLSGGQVLSSVTQGLAAGDQWSAITVYVEEVIQD